MSLDAICLKKYNEEIILIFGTTSGHLLFYSFILQEKKWVLIGELYCKTTILQTKLKRIDDHDDNADTSSLIYIASGNNGKIFIGSIFLQLEYNITQPK